MDPFAQDLHLSLGDDEELAPVFSFDDQLVAQGDLFRLEAAGHAGDDGRPAVRENSGTLRSDSGGNEAAPPETSTSIRSALRQLDLRAVDAVNAAVDLHPRQLAQQHRGVIDIIFGDVFVVLARFLATDVVTLRCNKLSDTSVPSILVDVIGRLTMESVEVMATPAPADCSRSL